LGTLLFDHSLTLTGLATGFTVAGGTTSKTLTVVDDCTVGQDLQTTDSPTFAGLIIADGGTIGQAAGPLLTFDDTNDYLEITGCKVGINITAPTEAMTIGDGGKLQINSAGDDKNIQIYHDDSKAIFTLSSGYILFNSPANINLDAGNEVILDSDIGEIRLKKGGGTFLGIVGDEVDDETRWTMKDAYGNMIIFTNFDNRQSDHEHVVQTNPTVYIHSDIDPDDDSTQWVSLTHNQTNAVFGLGIGAYTFPDGDFGIGAIPLAKLHVDQSVSDAAIPVLILDQADVSEEMIEFISTIGVGNAIEAVGEKSLTTTHFIKVTLPGALTRYIPVGTIA